MDDIVCHDWCILLSTAYESQYYLDHNFGLLIILLTYTSFLLGYYTQSFDWFMY